MRKTCEFIGAVIGFTGAVTLLVFAVAGGWLFGTWLAASAGVGGVMTFLWQVFFAALAFGTLVEISKTWVKSRADNGEKE